MSALSEAIPDEYSAGWVLPIVTRPLTQVSHIFLADTKRSGGSYRKKLPPKRYKASRMRFNKVVSAPRSGVPPFRRFAMAQSRLPSRLPGPAIAVMVRWIGLRFTTRPRRFRWIAPVLRVRIEQVAVP